MLDREQMPLLVAEFVGTFGLVFTVACNVLNATPGTWAATSIAAVLMAMIYGLGPVSGGHFNPAVSIAIALSDLKTASWGKTASYIVAQCAGGRTAGFLAVQLVGGSLAVGPAGTHMWWQAMLVEIIYTAMLAFVVLNVACSPQKDNQFFGLAIGFVIIAGGYAGGGISGGCFNPAVSFGLSLSAWSLAYAVFQVVGAGVAVALYRVVRPDLSAREDQTVTLPTKLACEFLGTWVLVFTVGLNVLQSSTATAWSAAAALMCMIYALGDVSGAHFNPAVTLAIVLRGKCPVSVGVSYAAAQLLAAALAAFTYSGLNDGRTFPIAPGELYTMRAACTAELFFTFVLAFVVLGVATTEVVKVNTKDGKNYYFALAIGACVTAGGNAVGSVSGGALNPAVTFGVAASHVMNGGGLSTCLIYSAFQLMGGVLAATVFYVTHANEWKESRTQL